MYLGSVDKKEGMARSNLPQPPPPLVLHGKSPLGQDICVRAFMTDVALFTLKLLIQGELEGQMSIQCPILLNRMQIRAG